MPDFTHLDALPERIRNSIARKSWYDALKDCLHHAERAGGAIFHETAGDIFEILDFVERAKTAWDSAGTDSAVNKAIAFVADKSYPLTTPPDTVAQGLPESGLYRWLRITAGKKDRPEIRLTQLWLFPGDEFRLDKKPGRKIDEFLGEEFTLFNYSKRDLEDGKSGALMEWKKIMAVKQQIAADFPQFALHLQPGATGQQENPNSQENGS